MNVNFKYSDKEPVQPIVFEQVFAEKPGGGLVANPDHDVPVGTAVGKDSQGVFQPIKGFVLAKAVASGDTAIQIAKGSGVKVGDVIATGKKAVKCTAVNTSNAAYDEVTVSLGIELPAGKVLFQAKAASADAAEPIYTPEYLTGDPVLAGKGDQPVKLVNGANIRKETAPVADEVVALMKSIQKV